jgi:peptidoglycan/LPS O-acetylase OafA/YrhL
MSPKSPASLTSDSTRLGHHPALDGIRGVAVGLVVLFHTWTVAAPGGLIGVDIFFVLSGFLITTLLLDERRLTGRISLTRFYTRRGLRLMPALLVVLIWCVVLAALEPTWRQAAPTLRAVPFSLGYVANWAYAYGADLGLLAHTWSLSVEEQFYLLWPLLLIGLMRWRGPRTALLACGVGILTVWVARAVMVAHGTGWLPVYGSFETRADALLAGCALALAGHLGLMRRLPGWLVAAAGFVGLAALAAVVRMADPYGWLLHGGFAVVAIAASLVLAALVARPWAPLVSLFSLRPLVAVGRVSYGVYLWHFPLIVMVYPQVASRDVASFVVILALAFTLASLSYAFVETPFLRLKRRLGGAAPVATTVELRTPVGAASVAESSA